LTDGSVSLIFQSLFPQIKGALLLLALLCILYILWKKQLVKESLPALLAAGVYLLGMIIVYLLSPNDLAWHLATSIDRTMLSVNACVFIGCYFILNTIENEVFYNHILK